jgi:hypothetical protein
MNPGLFKKPEEIGSGDLLRPQRKNMLGGLLTIDQAVTEQT